MFQLLVLGIFFFCTGSQPLTIEVSNIRENKGFIMIAVYDSADKFLTEDVFAGRKFEVKNKGKLSCKINLPYGTYGVSVYHDLDSDGELATNLVGIPTEPIGFSNNAKGFFGPPKYEKASFSFRAGHLFHQISLR